MMPRQFRQTNQKQEAITTQQKQHKAPLVEEIEESTGPLPEYEEALRVKLDEESRTKEKALNEATVKHLDFIIDLQNKFSRIALGLVTAIVVFLGWVYRDLNTDSSATYDNLNLICLGVIMVSLIGSAILLMCSNFIISKRQKIEKEKALVDQKIKIYTESDSNVPEFKEDKEKEANKLENKLAWYSRYEPAMRIGGFLFFAAAIIAVGVLLMYAVSTKISDAQSGSEDHTQQPDQIPDS